MLSREKHYYLHEDRQKKLIILPYVVRHTPVLRCTLWRFLSLSFLFDPWKSLTRIPGALRYQKYNHWEADLFLFLMRLYEVVKNALYLRWRYMHVIYHFLKKVQASKLTSFIWASAGDKRKIFGRQIEIVNYQFNFKVVWLLNQKEILVHWRSSIFIRFLKTEKEFKTVPIFYSEIRVLQGNVSMHCPYNLSLFISFTFLPYRELWYSICRSISSMRTFVRCYFSLFSYLPVRSLIRYPCLLLNISSYSVRQVFRTMLVLSSSVSLCVSLLLQQCLIILYVFLRSFYVSL